MYRATALHGNLVAIKILDRHLAADPVARLRFQHESTLALMHPNVVRVLEHGEQDGQPYIVMEYVAGESLDHLIARKGRLSPEEYAPILTDVARALDHAHKHGVIHRDVKPSNILIRTNGQAMLGDFGVAKVPAQTAYTATRTRIGSALYMSPEQAAGAYELTPASDIYALGVTTYYALCGRHPFEGSNEIAVARMHIDEAPQPPNALVPDLPKPVSDIVLWALHKRPAFRPQSAGQFAAEFRRAISAALLPAPPPQTISAASQFEAAARRPARQTARVAAPQQALMRPGQLLLALASTALVVALVLVALFNTLWRSPEQMTPTGPRIEAGLEGNPSGDASGSQPTPIAPTPSAAPAFQLTPIMPTPEMLILPPLPELPTLPVPWLPAGAPAATPTPAPTQASFTPEPEPPTVTPTPHPVTPPAEPTITPSATPTPTDIPTATPTELPSSTPQPTPTPTEMPSATPTPAPTEPTTQTPDPSPTP